MIFLARQYWFNFGLKKFQADVQYYLDKGYIPSCQCSGARSYQQAAANAHCGCGCSPCFGIDGLIRKTVWIFLEKP